MQVVHLTPSMKVTLRQWVQQELIKKGMTMFKDELDIDQEKIILLQLELVTSLTAADIHQITQYRQQRFR